MSARCGDMAFTKEGGLMEKYIIEIEEIPFEQQHADVFTNEGRMASPRANEQLFRAVGFTSLVFTREELNKLVPLTEDYVTKTD